MRLNPKPVIGDPGGWVPWECVNWENTFSGIGRGGASVHTFGTMNQPEWISAKAGRLWVARIHPGCDLKEEIVQWVQDHSIRAACVLSAVGSLCVAAIRFAGVTRPWNEGRDWELVSHQGSVGLQGVHLHLSVADADGTMFGGHLLNGSTVRTTVEIILQELDGCQFLRVMDTETGFRELQIGTDIK
jgi:uncharacterized protein